MQVILDTVKGRKRFLVYWRHVQRDGTWNKKGREHTICNVVEVDSDDKPCGIETHEIVYCSRKDQYCREKGRMLSFTAVLNEVAYRVLETTCDMDNLSDNAIREGYRTTRKAFWAVYKQQVGIKALKANNTEDIQREEIKKLRAEIADLHNTLKELEVGATSDV